jgi:S-adenosylmethionine decarboxylase
VTQSFCLGSHGTSLLLPNWNLFTEANINTTTSFYKPLDNPQHAGMIRHYHQRLHLDERFYSIPKREYFTDEYHMAESGGSAVSNPSGSSGSLDLPISKELGRHKVVEFKNVEALDKLQRLDLLRPAITKTLAAGNMTVVGMSEHQFKPHGVTMLALLTESHFSIHTWPELRFAAVDLFTCGSNVDTSAALRALAAELGVTEYAVRDMARGIYQ